MSAVGSFFKSVGEGIVNVGRTVLEATPLGALIPDQAPEQSAQPDPGGIEIDFGAVDQMVMQLWSEMHSQSGDQGGAIGSSN